MVDEDRHILFALHIMLDDDVLDLGAAVLPEVAEHNHPLAFVIVSPPDLLRDLSFGVSDRSAERLDLFIGVCDRSAAHHLWHHLIIH